MSKFLSLKEWLTLSQAMRYIATTSAEAVQPLDLISTYLELGYQAKLDFQVDVGPFTYELNDNERSFPLDVLVGSKNFYGSEEIDTGAGTFVRPASKPHILEKQEVKPRAIAWIQASISADQWSDSPPSPAYFVQNVSDSGYHLVARCWEELISWNKDDLLLRKECLDALMGSAYHTGEAPAPLNNNNYRTRLLIIQAQAIQRFWINYDPAQPDTAPDGKAIIAWLISEGCSRREAESIDLIIRHDSRKLGGAKPQS